MKLHQQLNLDGKIIPLTGISATLTCGTGGRAIVTTPTPLPLNQLVSVELGYKGLRTWFTGFVASTESHAPQCHRAVLREPAAVLAHPLPLSLPHPTLRQVLDNISAATGLIITCTDQDGVRQSANLTHTGTGYSLLAQLGTIFGIDNYTWFSLPDGSLWLGDWRECHWATRPITLDEKLYQAGKAVSGVKIPMLPAVRPDCTVNGHRLRQVMFDGTQLTIQWHQREAPQRREIKQLFPELAGRTHLALLGKVVAVCENVTAGHIQTQGRPALGVDVQLLKPDGSDDTAVPIFKNVPLPGSTGHGQGQFAFAQAGSVVELGFAFGLSHQPFVRTVLGLDWSMPALENGEYRCQFNDAFHKIDTGGNQQLHSEQDISISSQSLNLASTSHSDSTGTRIQLTAGQRTDTTLGQHTQEANAITLLGLTGTRIATEKNHEVLAGENILETATKLRKSLAAKHWAGTEDTNIYQLLQELMKLVESLAKTAASHMHVASGPGAPTSPPQQVADFMQHSTQATSLHSKLSPLL